MVIISCRGAPWAILGADTVITQSVGLSINWPGNTALTSVKQIDLVWLCINEKKKNKYGAIHGGKCFIKSGTKTHATLFSNMHERENQRVFVSLIPILLSNGRETDRPMIIWGGSTVCLTAYSIERPQAWAAKCIGRYWLWDISTQLEIVLIMHCFLVS